MINNESSSIINIGSGYGVVAPDQRIYINKNKKKVFVKNPAYPTAKGGAISVTAYATEPDSGAISYTQPTGTLPPGTALTVNNSIATISGTHNGSETAETTYTFSLEALDPESQGTTRSFSITITVGATNGGGFC